MKCLKNPHNRMKEGTAHDSFSANPPPWIKTQFLFSGFTNYLILFTLAFKHYCLPLISVVPFSCLVVKQFVEQSVNERSLSYVCASSSFTNLQGMNRWLHLIQKSVRYYLWTNTVILCRLSNTAPVCERYIWDFKTNSGSASVFSFVFLPVPSLLLFCEIFFQT